MVTVGQELIVNFTHPPLPVTVHREHLNLKKMEFFGNRVSKIGESHHFAILSNFAIIQ